MRPIERTDEDYGPWAARQVTIEQPRRVDAQGANWMLAAKIFAWLAFLTLAFAEIDWQLRTLNAQSVGVGSSGYALVGYARAIALGALATGCAVISIAVRADVDLRVFMRDVFLKDKAEG